MRSSRYISHSGEVRALPLHDEEGLQPPARAAFTVHRRCCDHVLPKSKKLTSLCSDASNFIKYNFGVEVQPSFLEQDLSGAIILGYANRQLSDDFASNSLSLQFLFHLLQETLVAHRYM